MRLAALLLALTLTAMSASAVTGVGEAPRADLHDILDAIDAPPMSELGASAFRFAQEPALGGRGYVLTFSSNGRRASAEIVWLRGHPRHGWNRTRVRRFSLPVVEFEHLAGRVDELLAAGEPSPNFPDGEYIVFCTDGPGYQTERLRDGQVTWMRGFCAPPPVRHPNEAIKEFLFDWLVYRLG